MLALAITGYWVLGFVLLVIKQTSGQAYHPPATISHTQFGMAIFLAAWFWPLGLIRIALYLMGRDLR